MYQQQSEIHLIKITLLLKKVNISVRFPCSISFALKNQNSIIEHKGIYQLKKGQCIINQNIEIQVEIIPKRGVYDQKKISLLIYMISANGKIPAGSVTINSTQKNIADKRASLQKCPDKNAQVIYTQNFEAIQVHSKRDTPSRLPKGFTQQTGIDLLASKIKYSSSSSNLLDSQEQIQNSIRSQFREIEEGRLYSSKHQRSNKDLRLSQMGGREYQRNGSRGRFTKFQQLSKKSVATIERESKDSCQLKASRVLSQFFQGQDDQIHFQKSKILRLEQDKANYIKKLSKIRDSLVRIDSNERLQLQEEIQKAKCENDILQDQMELLKQKTKSQQRKQRQSGSVMKELKDQLQKKKSRILQLDSSRVKIESQLGQKDKLIYHLEIQKKKLQQQIQQQKALVVSAQKRLQLKQNSYKQQLKKINQKYAQSQSQIQKAVIDYNNLLAQIQSNQKKNQILLREKQKNYIQQKSRLTKKIEQLNSQVILFNQKVLELKTTVDQYEQFKKKANEISKQKDYKINRLNEENQLILNEIRYSQQNYKKLSEEKERLQNLLSQDKVNYKKKYNQTLSELNTIKDKLQKNIKLNANFQGRMMEMENQFQQQNKEKNNLATKIQEYKRQVNKLLAGQENRQKMAQTLSVQNISQNQKIAQFKSKLEAQRKRFQQMENQYEEQVQYLVKSKQILKNQSEQLRWTLEKEIQKFEVVSAKNKEQKQEMIELNHKIIICEEKQSSYVKQIKQVCQFKVQVQKQLINLNQRIRTYAEKLRQRQQEENILQKKLQNLKQQNYLLLQNLEKINKDSEEKSQTLQKVQKLAYNQQKQNKKEITLLNEELEKCREMISRYKQQILIKNNQLLVLKESIQVINSDYSSLISKSDNIRQQDKKKDLIIEELQALLMQSKSTNLEVIHQLERKALEFQSYRSNVNKSLQQFFIIINKQQSEVKKESIMLVTLPEQNLSFMQNQALKKRAAMISKHQQQVDQLTNKIRTLQNQQKRQQKYIADLQQHHEVVLKKQQERYKNLSQQNLRQQNEFSQKMQRLTKSQDQRSNQIQFYNSQSRIYQSFIQQLNQIINKLREQNGQFKGELVKLENQIFAYKQKQIKDKLLSNTEAQQIKHILKCQQQRYREIIENHKQELKVKDKVISDRVEELKKCISRQQQWKIQIRKKQEKAKQLQIKLQAQTGLKQNTAKSVKQKQNKIIALQQDISALKQKIQQSKARQQAKQQQLKQYKTQIEALQDKWRSKKDQLQNRSLQVVQIERREKDKRQKIQSIKAKLQLQNKEIRQKCVKLQSQIEFYKFYKIQTTKKIQQLQKYKNQTITEIIKYRQNSLKNEKQIGNHENKYYKIEVEMQGIIKQKIILAEQNSRLKQKIKQREQRFVENQYLANQLYQREKEVVRLKGIIQSNEEQYDKMIADLKASLAKYKQTIGEKVSKIKELQKFVEEKYNDITDQRLKWQKQNQSQKNLLHCRTLQLEDKYQMIQQQFQFQKLQAIREVESANGIIQELNEVIREKEQAIEHKDEIINEQVVRLQELNIQLNECVNKWQSEKESYLPTETKMVEINEELNRMNKFISDLDGRNKQLLEINRRKMQQNIVTKPSITEQLKDVYILLQKNKNRILNRCQTEKQKQIVISEFKAVQQKLDLTLKSTQIIAPKQ